MSCRLPLALVLTGIGLAQTQVDLRTQAKGIDFSAAPSTKPFRSGTALPSTCLIGEMFFKSNAAAGANLYACTSADTWTVVGTAGSHTHTLAGDVTGDLSATAVGKLLGRVLSLTAPGDGQALVWSAAAGAWTPATVAGSGGASTGADLGDLKLKKTGATSLRLGESCTASTPCNVQIGDTVTTFTNAVDFTLATGTAGVIRVFIAADGTRQCRVDTITVTASPAIPCTAGSSFPADSILLGQWTASGGVWDALGTDWRPLYQRDLYSAGTGLQKAGNQFAVDAAVVGMRVAPPATSTSACTAGAWAADASFFYICVSDNAWRRSATAAW